MRIPRSRSLRAPRGTLHAAWFAAVLLGCGDQPSALALRPQPDEVRVSARVDNPRPRLGERVTLTLSAEHPTELHVDFPDLPEEFGGLRLTLADSKAHEAEIEAGRTLSTRRVRLSSLTPGAYRVPRLAFAWRKPDGSEGRGETGQIHIEVAGVASAAGAGGDLAGLRDIAGPVPLPPEPVSWTRLAAIAAAVLALLAAAALIFAKLTGRRIALPAAPAPPPPLPHVVALEALRRVREQDLFAAGEVDAFYTGVSGILRRYIEDGLHLNAPERTTEEFLAELRRSRALGTEHRQLLDEYLRHCDLVKFARYDPTRDEADRTLETSVRFIEQTMPQDMIDAGPSR